MELKLTVTERMRMHMPILALGGRCNPALVKLAIEALDALEFTEEEQALYGIKSVEVPDERGRLTSQTVWDPEHADTETVVEVKPALAKWLAQQVLQYAGWSPDRALLPLFEKMEAAKNQVDEEYGQMEAAECEPRPRRS